MIEKYYNEKGEAAVLITRNYGTGWSTRKHFELCCDKHIVEKFLTNCSEEEMYRFLIEDMGYDEDIDMGGYDDLEIVWVPAGTKFHIIEYDGLESVEKFNDDLWETA